MFLQNYTMNRKITMSVNGLKITIGAAALIAALAAGYSLGTGPLFDRADAAKPSPTTPAVPARTPMAATLPDMSTIVDNNGPAVVNISVSGTRKTRRNFPESQPLDPEDPSDEFFHRYGPPRERGEAPVRGLGSGFIVSSEGLILTNAHVVDGADEVTVKLTDKREFKAKVLGMEKASDVAVLKINAKNLPVVTNGSANNVRVGDWVLAIGSPFGFENSATAGIVSAKSRSLPEGGYVPFIQTDVAVNPGNSGGPLFNMAGEVIGINSQIYSRNGGYQGVSFAIPIDVAMNVKEQIVVNGKVERGRLGVSIQEVNQSIAESFGLKKAAGALVVAVDRDSPAFSAGIGPGDVILGINGKEISSSGELPAIVATISPGETVKLQVWRKGSSRQIDVRVGKFSAEKVASSDVPGTEAGRLGVSVRALTPEERRRAEATGSVVVLDVTGAAARAGIQPGDIVLSINGEPITKAEQLRALVAKAGKRMILLIERGDARLFVPVDLG